MTKCRTCTKCNKPIIVGKTKVGKSVFKGRICYNCWVKEGKPGRAKK